MNVIRHHHVTPHCYVKFICASEDIFSKCRMRRRKVINLTPVKGAEGDKEKGRIIALKNLMQPWRTSLNHAASVGAALSTAKPIDVEAGVSPAGSHNCGRHGRLYTGTSAATQAGLYH